MGATRLCRSAGAPCPSRGSFCAQVLLSAPRPSNSSRMRAEGTLGLPPPAPAPSETARHPPRVPLAPHPRCLLSSMRHVPGPVSGCSQAEPAPRWGGHADPGGPPGRPGGRACRRVTAQRAGTAADGGRVASASAAPVVSRRSSALSRPVRPSPRVSDRRCPFPGLLPAAALQPRRRSGTQHRRDRVITPFSAPEESSPSRGEQSIKTPREAPERCQAPWAPLPRRSPASGACGPRPVPGEGLGQQTPWIFKSS